MLEQRASVQTLEQCPRHLYHDHCYPVKCGHNRYNLLTQC